MRLGELSDLAQVIGAIAVVISIVYLAVQIRQNTRALGLSVHHAITDANAQILALLAQDPDLARLFRIGAGDFKALADDDRSRFNCLLHRIFLTFEDGFYHLRVGALPAPMSERFSRVLPTYLNQPGVRAWFDSQKHLMSDEFVKYVTAEVLPRVKQ